MGSHLLPFYQHMVELIVPESTLDKLVKFFNGKEPHVEDVHNTALYLVYYPSYILLHLSLITFLFKNEPKTRSFGLLVILVGISSIAFLTLVFHQLDWYFFYEKGMSSLKFLLGTPFVLFIVEGGRLLAIDIDRLLAKETSSN